MSVRQLFDLSGKVALITGGSRGLGLQMAEALGELGARIAITARKAHELTAAAEHLQAQGIDVATFPADMSQLDNIPALVEQVVATVGDIDILVNNAGASWGAPAEEYPAEAWRKVMTLNIDSVFFLAQEVGRRCMVPRQAGKIVNIASVAGLSGNPAGMNTIAYNTSKGAVVNFTRTLAAEWGKYGINVNAICPGFFPSKMTHGLLSEMGDAFTARTPLGRLGGEEDLKGLVALLASDASRHITGQWIAVDGGASVA
ncbi:gluconate 5-dehydrogenase [Alkalilimnicola ehrlichii]|uniref:Gluconate 5-dehydrogenase n=1 Tax=Alkalilimnicola ehrlichii TaxID=351052 RepID=A0A3E0WK33_9GAMM|nr:SDR family oxidoreductase [Alkalilimnicola ehrlichii]RFA25756.1 gluconate 5-dehydrogenase [Alkalilimnicola ehrlichii]RFA32839.1 gluconate 5-dehydrogenase [Alkalilimnicola ehrlichii]